LPSPDGAQGRVCNSCLFCFIAVVTKPSQYRWPMVLGRYHYTFGKLGNRINGHTKCNCNTILVNKPSRFGDRCFAAAGPCIWNNLPASLRDKEVSCTEFRRQLKTFIFQTDCSASGLSDY